MGFLEALADLNVAKEDKIDRLIEESRSTGWTAPRDYFSPSRIFFCQRGCFLARAGVPSKNSAQAIRRMDVGNLLHEYIRSFLRGYGGFGHEEEELKALGMFGKIDGIVDSSLVEIKTMGSRSSDNVRAYRKMPEYYVDQALCYVAMWNHLRNEKLDNVWFIVLNRDTMEWISVDDVKVTKELVDETLKKVFYLDELWKAGEMPKKKKSCGDCQHKSICRQTKKLSDILKGGELRGSN